MRKDPLLVTMNAPIGTRPINPVVEEYLALDDVNAGILALKILGTRFPNLRMRDLPTIGAGGMAGMFDFVGDIGDFVGRQVKTVKDAIGETARGGGSLVGDAVRLAADDKVSSAASKLITGGVSGFPGADILTDFLGLLGGNFKNEVAKTEGVALPGWVPWAAGAAGVTVLVLLLRPRGKR